MFKRGVKVDRALVAVAEDLTDELTGLMSPIEAVAWEIDAALSAINKDLAGYRRQNAANRNGGDSYTEGELERAVRRAKELLIALSDVRRLEAKWASEDALETARRTGDQGGFAFRPVDGPDTLAA